ncbi:MAG: gliding motility-associated C-terminal domain-containing protein, partial [Bacteroidales bacterium]
NLPMLDNATAGTYTVDITDANGCEYTEQVIITEPDPLELEESVTPVLCGINPGACGVSVSGGNGGYSYSWSHDLTATGDHQSGLGQGVYTVVVEDAEGCSAQTSLFVGTQGSLSISISEMNPITCYGEENAILNAHCSDAMGDVEYYWPTTNSSGSQIDNLGAGSYTVEVNDALGCSGVRSHVVVEPAPIITNFSVDPVNCYNGSDGAVELTAQGGTEPYSFIWEDLGNGESQENLSAGWYYVDVSDLHGCEVIDSVYIGQPDSPLKLDVEKQDITCYGYRDGRLAAGVEGGTAPYHYEWNADGATSDDNSINDLPEGFYQLTVHDENACRIDTSLMITQPAPIEVDYFSNNPSCIGNNDGYIELEVNGGTEPYTYFWENATASLPYFDDLYEGNYDILVTDAHGCEYDLETIALMDVPEECLRIPDAFTPNGDDNNDTWIIENLHLFRNYHVQVFNRWGQVLYEAQPGEEPWDGTTTDGKKVPTGSYIYIINLNNGSKPKSGVVTVVY